MSKIIFALLFLSSTVIAHDDYPSDKEIQTWVSNDSVQLYNKDKKNTLLIYLSNKERAYLVPASVAGKTRNSSYTYILVRPELKQAKVLTNRVIKQIEAVYDLDNDGVFELVVRSIDSGQGFEEGTKSIIQFEQWTPKILYQVNVKSTDGAYDEKDARYYDQSYYWEFKDVNNDGVIDLKERYTLKEGKEGSYPKSTVTNTAYTFKKGKFTIHE